MLAGNAQLFYEDALLVAILVVDVDSCLIPWRRDEDGDILLL